jgi:hypothetical protein
MITVDLADSPAVASAVGLATPLVSASFTPPALSLVVVMAAAGWSGATQVSIACSDSGSHTWSNPVKAQGTSSNGGAAYIFESYFATSPGAITISLAFSGFSSGSGGMFGDILVVPGAAANQSGAGVGSKIATTGLDGTFSLTTTKTNSWIFGASDDATNGATWTPNSSTHQDTQWNDTTDNVTMTGWYVLTSTPGAYTIGGTWAANGTSNHTTNQCAVEILPAADLPLPPVINYVQALRSSYL